MSKSKNFQREESECFPPVVFVNLKTSQAMSQKLQCIKKMTPVAFKTLTVSEEPERTIRETIT